MIALNIENITVHQGQGLAIVATVLIVIHFFLTFLQ